MQGCIVREIKFRAWNDKIFRYYPLGINIPEINRFEISQYTGLKDKNDIGIYEEDIIKDNEYIFIVKYQAGGFVLSPIKYSKNDPYVGRQIVELQTAQYIKESCEVIGNIYENKELLNDKF